jgi:DNA-binding MarR family transcriptional regulator
LFLGTLQQEIKQDRPFRSTGQEASVSLLRTADLVRRSFAAVVEPHGITLQQYNVLRILRGAGDNALPTLELARRMVEQTPGITRLLDRLEAKALVSRARCPQDRRQVLCRISSAGQDQLSQLDAVIERTEEAAVARLDKDDQVLLIALLDRVRSGVV